MPVDYLCSIAADRDHPRLYAMNDVRRCEKRCSSKCDRAKRRQQCPPAQKSLNLAKPDAQSVMANLVSSGTTRGERPFVLGSASIASEVGGTVTATGYGSNQLWRVARELREGFMRFQISRRGREYLETAQTLLRAAKTYDRPSCYASAWGPCRRLSAASRESVVRW